MNVCGINSYSIIELKRKLGIESTLSLSFTTFESGSNRIIERGFISQMADGDLKKKIVNVASGLPGISIIRLIYTDLKLKEPVINIYMYDNNNNNTESTRT